MVFFLSSHSMYTVFFRCLRSVFYAGLQLLFFSLFFYVIDTLCKDRMSCGFLIGISSLMVCTMSGTLFNGYEMVYCVLHRRGNQTTHLTISFTIFAHTSNMLKVSIHSTNNIPKKRIENFFR